MKQIAIDWILLIILLKIISISSPIFFEMTNFTDRQRNRARPNMMHWQTSPLLSAFNEPRRKIQIIELTNYHMLLWQKNKQNYAFKRSNFWCLSHHSDTYLSSRSVGSFIKYKNFVQNKFKIHFGAEIHVAEIRQVSKIWPIVIEIKFK